MIMKIADFIHHCNYQELPEKVIEKAKLCFLDFLGVTLRGSTTESAIAVYKLIKNSHESTVIGHDKSTVLDSALANGTAAHSLDLDDGSRLAHLHPGACVIPAALSVCEAYNKNGEDLISSMVAGYETAISLGIIMNPEHRNRGFHSTGTCGTFGSAAAASKSLNLDENQILNALGLAGTQASGLLESDHGGSMGKHLHAGKAAQSGVLSALLAREGFRGASTILEGKEGLFNATASLDVSKKNIELGDFHILNVYFKKYPVCRHLHSSLDAALHIMDVNNLNPDYIQKISVKTNKIAASHDDYHPQNMEALRQSLPWSIAIAVKRGDINVDNLEIDADLAEFSSKVVVECSQDLDDKYPLKRSSEVTIHTGARSYRELVDLSKGEPENQYTKSELINKFYTLNKGFNTDIMDIINNLEDCKVKDLMEMMNEEMGIS